jgi:hypothetical protein
MAKGKHTPEVSARIVAIKSLLVTGSDPKWVIDWCQTTQEADPDKNIPAKTWTVNRQQARVYVNKALEELGDADAELTDRKRARNRGLHMMIVQRLLAIGSVDALRAAIKAADQICKIDGSYDPSSISGPAITSSSTEAEAARLIDHAAATLALARARGSLVAPAQPTVIDIEPSPEESEDEPPAERPADAN